LMVDWIDPFHEVVFVAVQFDSTQLPTAEE
jgi:hypothetical protein